MSLPHPDLPAPVRGALWMLFASFCYVSAATAARHIDTEYSVFQLAFIRAVVALIILIPVLARAGRSAFYTRRPAMQMVSGMFTYLAILCWFFAAMRMPVAEFFALQFITPLITIALAAVILRQRASLKSWVAAFTGFAGVLIILRPGLIEVTLAAIATLASSGGYASVNTAIKVLSRTDSASVTVFYTSLLMLPLSLPLAVYFWQTPAWADLPYIIGVAVFSTVAFLATARAISSADARVVQPVNFMRMPIAAVFGYFIFSEISDLWTWTGALIIFASTYYILTRETQKTRGAG